MPSDFHSRHPAECDSHSCQICEFVSESDSVVVRGTSVDKILAGQAPVPYANRASWKNVQMDCLDLRRVHAHLSQGTRPNGKKSKQTAVRRYLCKVTISRDGLLVVRSSEPFLLEKELIVVPQHVSHGLTTSLHLSVNHPSINQLTKIFQQSLYALGANECIASAVKACSQCEALKSLPRELLEQSTSVPPKSPCAVFAADVMYREKQKILVLRDTFSSFTVSSIIADEQHQTMRSVLISSVSLQRPNPQTKVTIRVDNAPGLFALRNDFVLEQSLIELDFGRVHNKNKNPVVDKGIRELNSEILCLLPEGGPIPPSTLALDTSQLNARIRNRGLSAWEILFQRDQYTGDQLDISDLSSAESQVTHRLNN